MIYLFLFFSPFSCFVFCRSNPEIELGSLSEQEKSVGSFNKIKRMGQIQYSEKYFDDTYEYR